MLTRLWIWVCCGRLLVRLLKLHKGFKECETHLMKQSLYSIVICVVLFLKRSKYRQLILDRACLRKWRGAVWHVLSHLSCYNSSLTFLKCSFSCCSSLSLPMFLFHSHIEPDLWLTVSHLSMEYTWFMLHNSWPAILYSAVVQLKLSFFPLG